MGQYERRAWERRQEKRKIPILDHVYWWSCGHVMIVSNSFQNIDLKTIHPLFKPKTHSLTRWKNTAHHWKNYLRYHGEFCMMGALISHSW